MSNKIKQYGTWPFLEFTFVDAAEQPINCEGFSVRLTIKNRNKQIIVSSIVDEAGSGAYWIDKTAGKGEYRWKGGDTDLQGKYQYEFKFTRLSDNRIFRIPSEGHFEYIVTDSLEGN